MREGMLDAAILRFRHALELNPTSPGIRHMLGKALLIFGDAREALQLQEETFAMASIQAEWRYGFLALALWANDRVAEALDLMQKSTDVSPHDLPSLAVFQVEADKLPDARRTIEKLLQQSPEWRIGTDYLSNELRDARLRDRYREALRVAGAPE